ncbi:ABC transporter substrate-binding protein [Shewanella violacea]|uniref:Uncharacterized protein n=1 Tax=Shewanella violacea (strain JCM 10179 / CIP 106290 / LMG 19151 / DSS12) TaxID=637905 RepID=D4ZKA8_SHEVD|nr:hypothetical protein [Shewanella violacea]BAJ02107.1 conserved hypothetical protein [Shewanella violacea DSS12]
MATIDEHSILEYEMDTKRHPMSEFDNVSKQALTFIEKHKPKLVVLADDNALKLLGPTLVDLKLPLVFLGINANPRHYIQLNKNVSGTLERPLLKRSILMLHDLFPGVKNIKVLMDTSPTSYAILETSFYNQFHQNIAGMNVDISLEETFTDWKLSTKALEENGYDALIVANYAALTDKHKQHVSLDEISEWTSQNSPVPMFSFWGYSIGKGKAIGGLIISGVQQGVEAAKIVNGYFVTGKLSSITTPERGSLMFSEHELLRWNIKLKSKRLSNSLIIE